MKTKLNKIYHRYFPEIMTGILAALLLITGLLIFGIYNGAAQRNKMQEGQDVLLHNDSVEKIKQDSALKGVAELRDLLNIKKHNGGSKK